MYISDLSPDEIDKVKEDIYNQLEVLRKNVHKKKSIEKIDNLKKMLDEDDVEHDEKAIDSLKKTSKKISHIQRFIDALKMNNTFDSSRLMALTDGIFGIVMTLLIFGISLPASQINSYATFISSLGNLLSTIGVTVVSFILLASFWVYHHEFVRIEKFNFPFLWFNMIFVLFILFIPFTTSLVGYYPQYFLSEVIFGLNILLALIAFVLLYYYAYSNDYLDTKQSDYEKRYTINTFLMLMILTLVVSLLDYFVSPLFIYLFLLIPVISTTRDILYRMKITA